MELSNAAFLRAKPEKQQEVRSHLLELVPLTRKEAGCSSYRIYQSSVDPRDFFIHEEWVSQAAFDFHMQTPYVQQFLARQEELIEGDIEIRPYHFLP